MLADHSELAREHVVRVEAGQKEVGIETLDKILSALEVSLEDFFRGI